MKDIFLLLNDKKSYKKSHVKGLILLIILFFVFSLSSLLSVEKKKDKVLMDLSLEELMNIKITTANKSTQILSKASAAMIVITEQMIKDRGYHHLEEILHDLPGFDFNKAYGVNYSTIFMRGYRSSNSDRFILLYDGILENDIWKQTNWVSRQYPVTQIKQIEVLYGPASTLYGTNAFSGIINVITKKPEDMSEHNITFDFGSYGKKNLEFSSGKRFNENFAYSLTIKYFGADDLHPWDHMKLDFNRDFSEAYKAQFDKPYLYKDGNLVDGDIDGALPYDNYGIHANVFFGNFKLTMLNWTKKELEGYWYNPFKRRGKFTQWYINNSGYKLSHSLKINKKASINSSLMFRSHRVLDSWEVSQSYNLTEDNGFLLDIKSKEQGYGEVSIFNLNTSELSFEEQLSYTFSKKLNLISGGQIVFINTQGNYNSGTTKQNIVYAPRHKKNKYSVFTQMIFSPSNKLDLTIGGRYELSKDESGDGYEIFIPRLSAVFIASDMVTLRLQYAEAFQEPDDWHKFALDIGVRDIASPNLNPEKLKAYEFGTNIKLGSNLVIFGSLYYNNIEGLIRAVYDSTESTTYHWENLGKAKIYGYELSFQAMFGTKFSLNGNISGAFNKDDENEEIGDIAPVKVNLGLLFKNKKFIVFAKMNYVSKKNTINHLLDPNVYPIFTSIEGSSIIGLNIKYLNLIRGLDLHLKIDNVFDSEYYNPGPRSADGYKYNARVIQPGVNFMFGFSYEFK